MESYIAELSEFVYAGDPRNTSDKIFRIKYLSPLFCLAGARFIEFSRLLPSPWYGQ